MEFEPELNNLSENNRALRQLIVNNVIEVQGENDRYMAFFHQMQTDAAEFAATMNSLTGVWTDTATDHVEVKPQTVFSHAQYRVDRYPLWIIREDRRYGGSSLRHESRGYRYETPLVDKIVILKTGQLAIAHTFGRTDYDLNYWPNHPSQADKFVDRNAFDSKRCAQRLRTEWINDLEKAARKYAHKTT